MTERRLAFDARRFALVLVTVLACDRERVEVAAPGDEAAKEGPGSERAANTFPTDAAAPDAGCAKDPPRIVDCGRCPNGYRIVDAAPTCECCQ